MNNIFPLLTPAIEAYLIALIYRNTRTSCLPLAALCSFVSHDSLNRLLHSSLPWSRRLWELFSSRMIHEGSYLLLDDTTWQRQTKVAEAVSKVWSSSAGSVRLGMQVVLLVWTDGHRKIPVGIRLWQKGGKSKVELAKELIREAADRGLCPKYVLFDSWYTSKGILNLLEELRWKYVARIKSNRLLDGEQIRRKWRQRFGQSKGHLKQVTAEVRIIKDGKRYWVLKQEFGWGG